MAQVVIAKVADLLDRQGNAEVKWILETQDVLQPEPTHCIYRTYAFSCEWRQGTEYLVRIPPKIQAVLSLSYGEPIELDTWPYNKKVSIASVFLQLDSCIPKKINLTTTCQAIQAHCIQNQLLLNKNLIYQFNVGSTKLSVKVTRLFNSQEDSFGLVPAYFGVMQPETQIYMEVPNRLNIDVQQDTKNQNNVLRCDFSTMEELGVGGLDATLGELLEIIVLPRLLTLDDLAALQFQPSRGIIFSGPPGTGKTLLARKLSFILNAHFNLVRGPELLSGTVGDSAARVRKLFTQAEADWTTFGMASPLHVVVIDEIETLCPRRGQNKGLDGGATDQVVGQFLAIIDGLKVMNNILIIGTTNQERELDPALTRPGRLHQMFQINPPDLEGRTAIWRIHTKALVKNQIIEPALLPTLAENTDGFTGAEIAGCVSDTVLHARRLALPTTNSHTLRANAQALSNALAQGQFKITLETFLEVIHKYKEKYQPNVMIQ